MAQLCRAASPRSAGSIGFLHLASSCVAALGDVRATLAVATIKQSLWTQQRCYRCYRACSNHSFLYLLRCSLRPSTGSQRQLLQQLLSRGCGSAPHCAHICEGLAGHSLTKTFLIFTLLRLSDKAPSETTAVINSLCKMRPSNTRQ